MSRNPAIASPPPSLGRPRGFDAEAALRTAIDVFWQHGYEATSLEALSRAMGLSRSSFYAAFGSKHALLLAAVQRYADDRYAQLTASAAAARADPREAVRAMLAVIADVDGGSRGCLFVNTVAELAPGDAHLLALAQAHTARVAALMSATLRRAGCASHDAPARAGALLALVMGVTTLRKTGVPKARLKRLLAEVDGLIPISPTSPTPRERI